jgi:hypothetical protein
MLLADHPLMSLSGHPHILLSDHLLMSLPNHLTTLNQVTNSQEAPMMGRMMIRKQRRRSCM